MKSYLNLFILGALPLVAAAQPSGEQRARGAYLVRQVAMCVQCHTPRDQAGKLIEAEAFAGAVIPVQGPAQPLPWAPRAPAISGFSHEQLVALLTLGSIPGRTPPRPPMPPFRMTFQDADAIASYLAGH